MTEEQAEQLLLLMAKIDGGCRYCAAELMQGFVNLFPDYKVLAIRVYREAFDKELKDD
jgi:hypothetical protein